MLLKPLDFGIAVSALAAVVLSFFAVYAAADGRSLVNIKSQDGEWIFPVETIETMSVSGPLGVTVVEITEKGARVVSSPCMNQTCVAAGIVHSPGQWTACLPNRVMVYISDDISDVIGEGKSENNVDASAW